jgi:hypothetical protein
MTLRFTMRLGSYRVSNTISQYQPVPLTALHQERQEDGYTLVYTCHTLIYL